MLLAKGVLLPTVHRYEESVRRLEGFGIRIRHSRDLRDVRGDLEIEATYSLRRRAPDEWSVTDYLTKRLQRRLPGFRVEVVSAEGRRVNGQTKLRNVRAGYEG